MFVNGWLAVQEDGMRSYSDHHTMQVQYSNIRTAGYDIQKSW